MRQQYFGINFALVNLGIGLGGILGGLYADVSEPHTFTVIFLADGASMLVPIALLLGPLRRVHGPRRRTGRRRHHPGFLPRHHPQARSAVDDRC